jgi:hypothetical protein
VTPELRAAVEKVARRLNEATSTLPLDEHSEGWQAFKREQAMLAIRAVAEATREASVYMTQEARTVNIFNVGNAGIWRAMHAASILGEALNHE